MHPLTTVVEFQKPEPEPRVTPPLCPLLVACPLSPLLSFLYPTSLSHSPTIEWVSSRFFGGAAYENSRSPEEKEAFSYALKNTMDLWCAHACTPQHHCSHGYLLISNRRVRSGWRGPPWY